MRIHSNICNVIILCSIFVIAGCQAKRPAVEEKAQRPTTSPADPRGFDPLEFPEDREVIPVEHPRPGEISGRTEFVEAQQIPSDTSSVRPDGLSDAMDSLSSQAYRIQLFTAKVYGEASHERQIAEEIFDRPVYMDYEVPYFKVRVGDFVHRNEAEEYLLRARTAGYADAWVVVVNVRVKEAAPLYEDNVPPEPLDTVMIETEELFEDDQP